MIPRPKPHTAPSTIVVSPEPVVTTPTKPMNTKEKIAAKRFKRVENERNTLLIERLQLQTLLDEQKRQIDEQISEHRRQLDEQQQTHLKERETIASQLMTTKEEHETLAQQLTSIKAQHEDITNQLVQSQAECAALKVQTIKAGEGSASAISAVLVGGGVLGAALGYFGSRMLDKNRTMDQEWDQEEL